LAPFVPLMPAASIALAVDEAWSLIRNNW
jgi:hypothetical protein